MILKNTFNWDCCAFPKPLNTETIAIISSKGNAWCDVQLNGLQGKSAHYLRWHRTALQQERKNPNVLICLDFDAVEPMAELINPVVMYYLCKSLRNSPCGEVDAECRTSLWQMRTLNFFLWHQQLSSHANIFAPRVRSNYALHHHWCWNQLYHSY